MGRKYSYNNTSDTGSPKKRVDRGRGYKRVSSSHVEVMDLDLAAYIHMNNVPIVAAEKNGREVVVVFLDPDDNNKVDALATDWLNSEAAKFANCLRSLKKVAFSSYRSG